MDDIRRITTPEFIEDLARSIDPLAFSAPSKEERVRRLDAVLARIRVALDQYEIRRWSLKGDEQVWDMDLPL